MREYNKNKQIDKSSRTIDQIMAMSYKRDIAESGLNCLNSYERGILSEIITNQISEGVLSENLHELDFLKKNLIPSLLPEFTTDDQPLINLAMSRDKKGYIAGLLKSIPELRDEKENLFFMPEDYSRSSLDDFEETCEGHEILITLFQNFGLNPPRGLYIHGEYGTGKTHLMSAFALQMFEDLDTMREMRLSSLINQTIDNCYIKSNKDSFPETFQSVQSEYPYQVSDLAFATFDLLYDHIDDDDFITDFLERKIVFIDDIHHKNDNSRMEFIQRIIEQRYNEVRTGATFITSNISIDELLPKEYPKKLVGRIQSRLHEMCMQVHVDAEDYRLKIARQSDEELMALVNKRKGNKK